MSSASSLLVLAAAGGGAASAHPDAAPWWLVNLPLLALPVIFWLLIIRPQMRRQKAHQSKIGGLKKGDQVVTAGGLLGKVLRVDDEYVDLELAPNIKVKAVKATIGDVVAPVGGSPAND